MRHKRPIINKAVFGAFAFFGSCIALSPSFSGEDPCPVSCTEAGVSPGNWTVYHSVDRLSYCESSLILSFSAFSPLDDPNIGSTLRTCALDDAQPVQEGHVQVGHVQEGHVQEGHVQVGHVQEGHVQEGHVQESHVQVGHVQEGHVQEGHIQGGHVQGGHVQGGHIQEGHARTAASTKSASIQARSVNGTTSLNTSQYAPARALWNNESPTLSQVNISGLVEQLQSFLDTMSDEGPKLVFIYDSLSSTSIGIYAGTGVPTSPLVSALSSLATSQRSSGGALVQACNALPINNTAAFSVASSSEDGSPFTTAVGIVTASGPYSLAKAQRAVRQWASSSCVAEEDYAQASPLPTTLQTVAFAKTKFDHVESQLAKRGTCSTTTVQSGDLCADLARRCGISMSNFLKYNDNGNPNFCTRLRVPQLVCCSEGNLPVPEADSNGNCKPHEVQAGENCWSIANDNSFLFSVDDLEDFNKNTWGWGGCKNLQASTIICLSPGSPPLPKPVPNAMCGPVKPGTVAPPNGIDMATLNPCPLNSCCDVWGFCGTTDEFCQPVPPGQAPGAPQPIGAPNCISNCGTKIVNNGSPPPSFIKIGYFEGYGVSRACQAVDIRNIDKSKYTHIHFAFATVTPGSYEVDMGPTVNQYYYFKRTSGVKKILSFGGWTFSTDPATYGIFRQGVLSANRDRLAQNIANFIIDEGLDGVDIDWEYPAAPDLPDIPTAGPEDGENYYLFLQKLRSILPPSKSVSFAAPASFWYLRGFPIAKMMDVVDYVVYMTYDLHGQWDYGNKWTDSGCPGGNCLRSHLNLTETINALSMITKAGVPANKIAVGIASYGRSFQMADPQCTGPMCTYTGRESGATPGRCTKTAGYISNAEIREILATNPTARKLSDGDGADVLVYDNDQWVSYMDDNTKARRSSMYQAMNFLGTTDWAVSLDNAGLVDEDDGDGDDDHGDDGDNSGDLGLGRLPGLVFKAKKRKLGKGAVQPTYHESCKDYLKSMKQSWLEAGKIADATLKYSPDNKFQRVLDIYFGKSSESESSLYVENFRRMWESHWGNVNKKNPKSLGMNVHAKFFCGNGKYKEIFGGKIAENACLARNTLKHVPAGVTYQFGNWEKKSVVYTIFCEHATHATDTFSLEKAEEEADGWDYHLKTINMWQQQVRAMTFYHEGMHWRRISRPWLTTTIGQDKKNDAIKEQYALKDIMALTYNQRVKNAESWALAAMAMWIMDNWGGDVPVPVIRSKRSDIQETPDSEEDDDGDDAEWEAEMARAEKSFQENHNPALVDPANFLPLFDEDEIDHEIEFQCEEGRWFWAVQCSIMCQGGLCTETFDGHVLCSNCNATTDEDPYKLEEFHDNFGGASMEDWKIYKGGFQVSPAGLSADDATEGEAIIHKYKIADFIFEADLEFPAAGAAGDAGLVFRATNLDQAQHGYTVGHYYAGVSPSSGLLFLNRMPDNVQLASAKMDKQNKGTIHLKVQAINETISVYVGDASTPQLVQKDATFESGFNGVEFHNTGVVFSNVDMVPMVRQRGILDNCSNFYRAVAGDTCQGIADKHDSISVAQLHSWNPALQDDCSGLKTDYFYCVAREDNFRLKTKYNSDCSGDVHNDVALSGHEGKCIDTDCAVGSLDVASGGDCPSGQVQISYWEQPGCSGKWFGYGYTSRDTCRSLWTNGWKFGSLHLRCADPWLDCVSLGTCIADEEPARGICEAPPPTDPLAAFKLRALYYTDCSGDVHKELSVEHGNGICLNTGCNVGSLDIAELGDCPDGQVRISYWGGEECAGAWYGYGYGSRNTCRTLWSGGSKFKSLWLSCAKESDDCVSQKTCTADPEPTRNIC